MINRLIPFILICCIAASCSQEQHEQVASLTTSEVEESAEIQGLSFTELFEKYRYAVAEVKTEKCEGENGGTAFFVSETIAITAFHVVEEARSIVLWLENDGRGKVFEKRTPRRKLHARLLYGSEETDLAVLQVPERTTQHISFVPFGLEKEMPKVGEQAAVFGFPNSEFIFSPGQVIATNVIKEKPSYPLIITDAYSGPGGSGGPLVTAYGDAIGVIAGGRNSGSSYIHSLFHTELWNPIGEALDKAKTEPNIPPPEYFCVGPIDLKAAHDDVWQNELPETGPLHDIKATYALWLLGINSGNEELAFRALSANFTSGTTIDSWVEAHSSTLINDFYIFDLDNSVPEELRVTVRFTSTQSDEHARIPGENCTQWIIRHTLVPGTITSSNDSSKHMSLWKIDKSESLFGFPQECSDSPIDEIVDQMVNEPCAPALTLDEVGGPIIPADSGPVSGIITSEGGSMYATDPDTGIKQLLIEYADNPWSGNMIWSPDRTRFLYEEGRSRPGWGMRPGSSWFIADSDGSNQKELGKIGESSDSKQSISWSPDGNHIMFVGETLDRIWLISGNDFAVQCLISQQHFSDDESSFENVQWSPDSSHISFEQGYAIYVVSADGTDPRIVFNDGYVLSHTWTADDNALLVSAHEGDGSVIYKIDVSSSNLVNLTPRNQADLFSIAPIPSPDGSQILFSSNRHRDCTQKEMKDFGHCDRYDTYLMNADGSLVTRSLGVELSQVALSNQRFSSVVWSPNGTQIMISFHSHGPQQYLADPDGQNSRLLDIDGRVVAWIGDYEDEENHDESGQRALTS